MTARHILITGGAGFIEPGRARVHPVEALLAGYGPVPGKHLRISRVE